MGAISNVKVNRDGVIALLKSPEVMADLHTRADRIAAAAGEGMEVEEYVGKNRDRVTVRTATNAARVNEARDRALTKAIDAGR